MLQTSTRSTLLCTPTLQFFCYSHLISVLCRTAYSLRYLIRMHSRPLVVKKFDLLDRNSVVLGKIVDLGCRRIIKRKNVNHRRTRQNLAKDGEKYYGALDTQIGF